MAIAVQLRRGTSTQNNSFTGAVGELVYTTDTKDLYVHDGSNAGTSTGDGATVIATDAVTTAKIDDSAVTTIKINNGAVTSDKLSTTLDFGSIV